MAPGGTTHVKLTSLASSSGLRCNLHEFLPLTLLVRALRLRPTEVPVRPCRVPREARVFRAAPAVDPVVEPAVLQRKDKHVALVTVVK